MHPNQASSLDERSTYKRIKAESTNKN